jgi:hypothetical protein
MLLALKNFDFVIMSDKLIFWLFIIYKWDHKLTISVLVMSWFVIMIKCIM